MAVICEICGKQFDTFRGLNGHRNAHIKRAESYKPPASAVKAAKKGLAQRKEWGRGGLSPSEAKSQGIDSGVTRARKIASGSVSRHDVRRMSAFNRHRKNNRPDKKMPDGGPTAGTIAWNLWGGTSGVNWAKKKSAAMNAEELSKTSCCCGADESDPCACMKAPEPMSCRAQEPKCACYKALEKNAESEDYNSFTEEMESLINKYGTLQSYDTSFYDNLMEVSFSFRPHNPYFDDVDFDAESLYDSYDSLYAFIKEFSEMGNDYVSDKGAEYLRNHLTIYHAESHEARYDAEDRVTTMTNKTEQARHKILKMLGERHLNMEGNSIEGYGENDSSLKHYPVVNHSSNKPITYQTLVRMLNESFSRGWGEGLKDAYYAGRMGFDAESFGPVDEDGQLAKALAAVREKSKRYAPTPLRLTNLPHPDQKTLKDFEADWRDLSRDSSGRWLPAGDDSTVSYDMTDMSWMTPSEYYQYVLEEPLDISDDIEDDTQTIEFQDRFVRYTAMTMSPQVIDALIEENELEIVSDLFADPAEAEGEIAFLKAVKRYQQFSEEYSAE
jgi:hypothetical protein